VVARACVLCVLAWERSSYRRGLAPCAISGEKWHVPFFCLKRFIYKSLTFWSKLQCAMALTFWSKLWFTMVFDHKVKAAELCDLTKRSKLWFTMVFDQKVKAVTTRKDKLI
jgi:hypothetical protein